MTGPPGHLPPLEPPTTRRPPDLRPGQLGPSASTCRLQQLQRLPVERGRLAVLPAAELLVPRLPQVRDPRRGSHEGRAEQPAPAAGLGWAGQQEAVSPAGARRGEGRAQPGWGSSSFLEGCETSRAESRGGLPAASACARLLGRRSPGGKRRFLSLSSGREGRQEARSAGPRERRVSMRRQGAVASCAHFGAGAHRAERRTLSQRAPVAGVPTPIEIPLFFL